MRKLFLVISFAAIIIACSSSDGGGNSGDNFNRTVMLTNWADNIIIPSYTNYQTKVQTLQTDATAFTTSPTQNGLQTLRTSWLEAYKAYQTVTVFNIGKAMEINFKERTNTYPTNAAGIETNISSGTYDFSLLSQFDRQGFPALDYVLNGLAATDAEIIGFYTTNGNAVNYKQYIVNLTAKLKTDADLIVTDWNSGYRDTFVTSNGNAVSSSVNKVTNLFVKNFEKDIRAGKIGIPAGIFSGGTLFPEKTEAFYKNDVCKVLLFEALKAQQDFFNGKHFNSATTGESLKSYLDFLNAVRDGQNLSDVINNQFTAINSPVNALDVSFSQQINTDNTKMLTAYDALQQNVVYTKLDMMQALNITIDYVDNDGD